MSIYKNAGVALLLMVACATAHAEIDPHDLAVEGTIRTPACTVVPENGGVFDFGSLSNSLVPVSGHFAGIEPITQQWSVDCGEARTTLIYTVTDNRADSVSMPGVMNFSLGDIAGRAGSKIGYFTVWLSDAMMDGANANIVRHWMDDETGGTSYLASELRMDRRFSWRDTAGSYIGSKFDIAMQVKPYLANATLMGGPLVDAVPLGGSLTISYVFGL